MKKTKNRRVTATFDGPFCGDDEENCQFHYEDERACHSDDYCFLFPSKDTYRTELNYDGGLRRCNDCLNYFGKPKTEGRDEGEHFVIIFGWLGFNSWVVFKDWDTGENHDTKN